ncbi:hypothetical protein [Pelosinus baikalensis]|uniref:Uncharacterized protein n=1 Tax=Pelosinus baikalensis TaxID=2892015 RepID=A0ABS8I006_9FIRM|nr:hypothetical protein [Pelosinus baikalensis]MCC5468580.1 hypothetical protein [Pelosinus baikalensis]MCC5468583.1 hypothetical protein [Pelosinus baikalensis]
MARSRNIKPGFFTNDELAEIEPLGRLLFAGLWTIADREGRLEDRPKKIKIEVLPYDNCDIDSLLQELSNRKFILRYEVNGERYIQILTFIEHQNPHRNEKPSTIPAPDLHSTSTVQAPCINSTSNIQEQFNNESGIVQGVVVASEQEGASSVLEKQESSKIKPSKDSGTSTVQAPDKNSTNLVMHSTNRADSFNMIPDSLNKTTHVDPLSIEKSVDNFSGMDNSDNGIKPNTDFMIFWNEYPRRSGMNKAVEAWNKLMQKGIPPNDLVRAAKKYSIKVKSEKVDLDYIKMPQTFLSSGAFKEYAPVFSPDCPECRGVGCIPVDKADPAGAMTECSCKKRLDVA